LWELVLVYEIEDEAEVWFDSGDWGFDEGCEKIDCVGVYSCSFVFGRVEDCFADITWEGEWLRWCGCCGVLMVSRGGRLSVEFVDVWNVVGANCCNRLGGACKWDGCTVFIFVGCELGAAVLPNVSGAGVLR
jgi:hypothetical protein